MLDLTFVTKIFDNKLVIPIYNSINSHCFDLKLKVLFEMQKMEERKQFCISKCFVKLRLVWNLAAVYIYINMKRTKILISTDD